MRALLVVLALALAACGPDTPTAPDTSNTPAETTAVDYYGLTKFEVERLYVTCSICHGKDGKKAHGGAKDLSESTLSFDERVAIIKYGKGKMTPYEGRLKDAQMRALAKYVETFKK